MVIGVLVGTATVTTQGLTGSLRHDETKSGDLYLAKNRGLPVGHQRGLFHGHGQPLRLVVAAALRFWLDVSGRVERVCRRTWSD